MFWQDFITIALVHLVAVASPGPDFAIVVRNSLAYGRRIAIFTSIGIGLGILIHVAYSLVGLSVVIKTTPWLYQTISYLAAAYLIYLAIGALKSGPPAATTDKEQAARIPVKSSISPKKALWMGFLTNGLNPKATLFFLSLFTAFIDVDTPTGIKLTYGIYLAVATGMWFCFLSFILGSGRVTQLLGKKGYWLDRTMGVLLLGLAAKLVFA